MVRSDGTFAPGTMASKREGSMAYLPFDLSRVAVRHVPGNTEAPWMAWIPPRGPQDYEGGDTADGDMLAPYGESYWPTWNDACTFVYQVTRGICESV